MYDVQTHAPGPAGSLPLDEEFLRAAPSGDLFGLTQDAGMGWDPAQLRRHGVPDPQHAGRHPRARMARRSRWAITPATGRSACWCRRRPQEFSRAGRDPVCRLCQRPVRRPHAGHAGHDGQPALSQRRRHRPAPADPLAAHAPRRDGRGHLRQGPAGDDDGAGRPARRCPCVLVPGGVTLPPERGRRRRQGPDRSARASPTGELTLEEAAELGCRACASPGGGCQFLGTAATSQVVAEALGLAVPHSALAPSGQPIWLDMARALGAGRWSTLEARGIDHARHPHRGRAAQRDGRARGLRRQHQPAAAHPGHRPRRRPAAPDRRGLGARSTASVPRLVDVLPNGPTGYRTVQVFLAGGVPEVMLHLRELGLLRPGRADGRRAARWAKLLDEWEHSERRRQPARAAARASTASIPTT